LLRQRCVGSGPRELIKTHVTEAELMQQMLRSVTQSTHEAEDAVAVWKVHPLVTPEPQLIVRTSGEMRLSNFLLYECAYSELFFVSKSWPELLQTDLRDALENYTCRKRRFGQ